MIRSTVLHLIVLALALLAFHLVTGHASEPFFNNDETRHTMTGVFVRDALADFPGSFRDPKAYAEGVLPHHDHGIRRRCECRGE